MLHFCEQTLKGYAAAVYYICPYENTDVINALSAGPTKMISAISEGFAGQRELFAAAQSTLEFACRAVPDERLQNNLTYYWKIDEYYLCSDQLPINYLDRYLPIYVFVSVLFCGFVVRFLFAVIS